MNSMGESTSRDDNVAASQSRRYHDWYGGERRQSWATPPAFFAPLHAEYGFTWGLTSLSRRAYSEAGW